MYRPCSVYPFIVSGCLGGFHPLAVASDAAVNTVLFETLLSILLGMLPRRS